MPWRRRFLASGTWSRTWKLSDPLMLLPRLCIRSCKRRLGRTSLLGLNRDPLDRMALKVFFL